MYAGFLIKSSIDLEKVNPKYIKYYCMSDAYKGWVHSFNTGSTRGNINAQTLGGMPISFPPRPQQDGIVDTLSSLDSKIRKNVDVNDYLLAMERSPIKDVEIKYLLNTALVDGVDDRELYRKGIDISYYYEGYVVFKTEGKIIS